MSNTYYKAHISFKGSDFLGWQKQKDFTQTVQEKLDNALVKIFKSESVNSIACGRTDSGVHAFDMTVKLNVPFDIEKSGLLKGLNSHLPKSIRIISIENSTEQFRPTYDAKSREYFYLFSNKRDLTPFCTDLIARVHIDIDEFKINEALALFCGEHDFKNFMCVGSEPKTTVREIFSVKLELVDESFHGLINSHYKITIIGAGFLKQMVRLMVGAAFAYSDGKITLNDISQSLISPGVKKLSPVAPANGLYKSKVSY